MDEVCVCGDVDFVCGWWWRRVDKVSVLKWFELSFDVLENFIIILLFRKKTINFTFKSTKFFLYTHQFNLLFAFELEPI